MKEAQYEVLGMNQKDKSVPSGTIETLGFWFRTRPSLNFQRGDFVVGEHEREVELDGAPGEVTRQPGAEFHGVLTHRSIERFHNVPVLSVSLLFPGPDGIQPPIIAVFVMHPGIVGKAESQHIGILCFHRGQVGGDWGAGINERWGCQAACTLSPLSRPVENRMPKK